MPPAIAAPSRTRSLDASIRPLDLLARWPTDRALACLVSSGSSPRARWSIFASPTEVIRCDDSSPDPLAEFAAAIGSTSNRFLAADPAAPPFVGGWIGWLSYDLGRRIEPAAQAGPRSRRAAETDRPWPLLELFRCPGAYVHDGETNEWTIVGDRASLPAFEGIEPTLRGLSVGVPRLGACVSRTGRPAFEGAAARIIEYTRTGDIFQANIAHRLSADFEGSTRAIAHCLLSQAGAWYGGYIESPANTGGIRHAICSASPELFLSFDARTRRVVTRPIKGTRPASPFAANELAASAKDAAELTMIVDLMRNDLGRVCEYGSVIVDEARAIESHGRSERHSPQRHRGTEENLGVAPGVSASPPETDDACLHNASMNPSPCLRASVVNSLGILHGVATISGTLRPGLGVADLLRAAFPPGSVTGAPKIRAMQIIDALEPVRRGPYCGCVGFVSDSGDAAWNVAIRTAVIMCNAGGTAEQATGVVDYSVGAGIVSDSDPTSEWDETMHKAGILRRAFPESLPRPAPRP